jgi:hypothetical protein
MAGSFADQTGSNLSKYSADETWQGPNVERWALVRGVIC